MLNLGPNRHIRKHTVCLCMCLLFVSRQKSLKKKTRHCELDKTKTSPFRTLSYVPTVSVLGRFALLQTKLVNHTCKEELACIEIRFKLFLLNKNILSLKTWAFLRGGNLTGPLPFFQNLHPRNKEYQCSTSPKKQICSVSYPVIITVCVSKLTIFRSLI